MKRLIAFLMRCVWWRKPVIETPLPPINDNPAPVKRQKKQRAQEPDNYGTFVYFDDVLDKLDSYFKYLRYLKKDDPDTYDLYSKVGGQITGTRSLFFPWELPPGWLAQRPAFGMVHVFNEDSKASITPKLAYYQKMRGHANLQPVHGDIYEVVLYYVDSKNSRLRYPLRFHIHVSTAGAIFLLKERVAERITIKHRQGGRGRFSTIARQTWAVPDALLELFKDNPDASQLTIHEAAAQLFRMIAGISYTATDGVRVNVYKGSLCGVFNIATERTAYFFKDREKSVNVKGATKRIFHAARAHMRTLPDGREVPVRMHFRGERAFTWNGYRVLITVSGLHHANLTDFDAPTVLEDEHNDFENYITMKDTGKLISQMVARSA